MVEGALRGVDMCGLLILKARCTRCVCGRACVSICMSWLCGAASLMTWALVVLTGW